MKENIWAYRVDMQKQHGSNGLPCYLILPEYGVLGDYRFTPYIFPDGKLPLRSSVQSSQRR